MLRKSRLRQKNGSLIKKKNVNTKINDFDDDEEVIINVFENFTLIKTEFFPHQSYRRKKSSKKELMEEIF